jgi:hypothetical protein
LFPYYLHEMHSQKYDYDTELNIVDIVMREFVAH